MRTNQMSRLPFPPIAFAKFATIIKTTKIWRKKTSIIVFVCGAQISPNRQTNREIFLDYANRYITDCNFFQAEKVIDILRLNSTDNILMIEKQLADYSDCIIMILESVGTLVELGAFSINDELSKTILAISDVRYKSDLSFINDGPLKRLNAKSHFRPTLYVDLSHQAILDEAKAIQDQLSKLTKRRKMVDFSTAKEIQKIDGKELMLFLCDIISLFSPIAEKDIQTILNKILVNSPTLINIELSLLHALGLVQNIDGWYLRLCTNDHLFYDYGREDMIKIRSQVLNHYHKYHKEKLLALQRLAENNL